MKFDRSVADLAIYMSVLDFAPDFFTCPRGCAWRLKTVQYESTAEFAIGPYVLRSCVRIAVLQPPEARGVTPCPWGC